MGGTSPRPVPRWLGRGLVVAGLAVNELTLELTVVPDEEIGSSAVRLGVVGFQLACLALGAWVLVRRPRSRIPWHGLALGALSGLLAWFACFAVLDTQFPGALGATGVRYFSIRARYAPDSVLVMVPRRRADTVNTVFVGDLYDPEDGVAAVEREYRATFNELGFRTNLGEPPYELVVIGDSFVAFGERDDVTLSEELRRATGLSTFNLGREWYGPFQYVELMRRHGVDLRPKYAVLCFFEGNDIGDTGAYLDWRRGGTYSEVGVIQHSLPERFVIASGDLVAAVFRWISGRLGVARSHPGWGVGTVLVDGEPIRMRFAYWPGGGSAEELLRQEEWEALASLFAEFDALSRRHGVIPVVVFIPAKVSVYGADVVEAEGRLAAYLDAHSGSPWPPSHSADALRALTGELSMRFVDLGTVYRARSAESPLLYDPYDTHWTHAGRALAAEVVADTLAGAARTAREADP